MSFWSGVAVGYALAPRPRRSPCFLLMCVTRPVEQVKKEAKNEPQANSKR